MMRGRRVMGGALAVLLVAMLAPLVPQPASAATVTWDGETDSNWATATNWVGNVAPVTGDDVVLTGSGNAPTNNNLVGVELLSVTISSAPGVLTIGGNPVALQSGGSITYSNPDDFDIISFGGGVTLNGPATFTASAGSGGTLQFITNPIAGTGPLTLVNNGADGLLRLGQVTNTYTGATTVDGTFYVALNPSSIPDTSALTVEGIARFLDSETIGSLAGSGTVQGNGALTVGGDNTSTAFSGVYQDNLLSSSLVKTGTGTLTLSGANTYTGGTTVNAGLINFAALNNFGTGTVTLDGGGLQWASGTTTDVSARLAALGASGATFDTNGNDVTLGTALSGTGGLTKTGTGALTLSGANTYSGGTTIDDGTLALGASNVLPDAGAVVVSGGTLSLGANSDTVGTVTLSSGTISSTTGTLTGTSYSVTNAVGTTTISAILGGTGGLTKTGTGSLTLSGANTYSGATTVSAGTLTVTGSTAAGTTITVQSGATLGGTGTINGNVVLEDGATLSGTLTISGTVNPLADGQSVTTDEDTAVVITLTGSDGNSDPLIFLKVADPTKGTLGTITSASSTSATVTYTPNANENGADSFTFKANDGGLDSSTATVTITINAVNDAPVATAQSPSTNEDTAVTITLTGTDVDGDTLTFSIATNPANGVLSGFDSATGAVTYTPNSNYNGADSFTFKVNDGTVDSTAATISITVNAVNDLPVANAQSVTTDEDDSVSITLTGTDIDGDALTYTIVSGPSDGTLSGTAPNLVYEPDPDFNGADSFTFLVNDGTGDSAAATVSITVDPVDEEERRSGGGGGKRTVVVNQGSSVTLFPESHFADNPLDRIQVSSSAFINAEGASVSQAGVGQQLSISGTFTNHQKVSQDYAFIVQVTNEDGSVAFIGLQQGTIESGQTADVSTSWTPMEDGSYTVQIFVWNGLGASPTPLSQGAVGNIEVTE